MTLLTPMTFEENDIHSTGYGSFLDVQTHYILFGRLLVLGVFTVVYSKAFST